MPLLDPLSSRLPATRARPEGLPLHGTTGSRAIEHRALQAHPPMTLMQRAGLAVARLAQSVMGGGRPHASSLGAPRLQASSLQESRFETLPDSVVIVTGSGDNGGDGWVAARHLLASGYAVQVWEAMDSRAPEALQARAQAQAAGVAWTSQVPAETARPPALVIDALLGLGVKGRLRDAAATAVQWMQRQASQGSLVLSVDLPSGLDGANGGHDGLVVVADHTISLLTLKPGLFTHEGRECAGRIWLDDLACGPWIQAEPATARLAQGRSLWPQLAQHRLDPRRGWRHSGHKGAHGDTWVIGGAAGMGGAAVLAARAALEAGAGRVHLLRLDGQTAAPAGDGAWPELMSASPQALQDPARWRQASCVVGCGGGDSISPHLPVLMHHSARLVLDADALNAVAADAGLRQGLQARAARGLGTVLTPHPLEAARLLGCTVADVQLDRLQAAQALADRLRSTVVLKGSGSITATPDRTPWINGTGNARLSTAGSGDVLAGWIGGAWKAGDDLHTVAAACVELHGRAAQGIQAGTEAAGDWGGRPSTGEGGIVLRAGDLIGQMALQLGRAAHGQQG